MCRLAGTGDISPVFRCAGGAGQRRTASASVRGLIRGLGTQAQQHPQLLLRLFAETHDLLRQVLTGCGQGMSVRACVMRMADGDHSRMLRYQNKYRAILKHHPEMIAQVRQELLAEGVAAPAQGKNPPDEAENRAASQMMAEPCVLKMLEGMKELLQRASAAEEKEQLQRSLDRMRVEQDLRRIAWEKDYDAAVQLIREMRACLESVRNSLDGEKRCDVEDCLAKAASFPNKHAGEA